jgi:hypothetical protein
VPVR